MNSDSAPASNVGEYSVSEISGAIKRTMEDTFGRVRVRGELGRVSRPASGHVYLDLKDDRSVLAAVIWKGAVSKLAIRPEEGLEVIATGRITTFPGQSKYQMVIDDMEPAGAGALMALLEERRRKLADEGLFDAARKRPLPYMPRTIGVVTSPTGAVIRDIIHRINDRFPLHLIVWPVRVQGESSAAEVAAAVNGFNALDGTEGIQKPDLLIVARGGGSLEDLWGYNEEVVVRAVAGSRIPVISAVGHETDTTLCDHAADLRAPTPTAAAEIAVPVKADLEAHVSQLGARLRAAISRASERRGERLRGAARGLPRPDALLALPRQRLDTMQMRLASGLDAMVAAKRQRQATASARLSPASLRQRLERERVSTDRMARALPAALERAIGRNRRDLDLYRRRLTPVPLLRRLGEQRQRTDAAALRGERAALRLLSTRRDTLSRSARLLETLSYQGVLSRGFALVRDAEGKPVTASAQTSKGQELTVHFAGDDGISVIANGPARAGEPAKKSPASKPPKGGNQGSLF